MSLSPQLSSSPPSGSVLAQLQECTEPYQERLVQRLHLLRPPFSLAAYVTLLQGLWGFYTPLESRLGTTLTAHAFPFNFTIRRKRPLLAQDLRALGMTDAAVLALPLCSTLPVIGNIAQAFGCLYVLERVTVEGPLLSDHFHQLFGFTAERGCTFFTSYGEGCLAMWETFCDSLTKYATTTERQAEIIASACATCVALERWLEQYEVQTYTVPQHP